MRDYSGTKIIQIFIVIPTDSVILDHAGHLLEHLVIRSRSIKGDHPRILSAMFCCTMFVLS
jgi:hypothetical protein